MRSKLQKKLFRLSKRGIALLLFLALLTQDCLVSYATNTESEVVTETETESEPISLDTSQAQELTANISHEIVEKREEYTKHFQLDDGTIMAATYKEPVHYLEEKEYQEIDTTLLEETEDGEDVLGTGKGLLSAKFQKKSGNKLLTIGSGNSKIKVSLEDANKVAYEQLESVLPDVGLDENLIVENKTGIIYRDILENTDIAYLTGSSYLKENIILKEKEVPESFVFTYEGKDIDYQILESGDIEIYLNGSEEKTYQMNAPFMIDANGKTSEDVEVQVKKDKKRKTLTITLTPSKEFLEADDTVYPVVIDPPVTTSDDYTAIKDTYVSSAKPTNSSLGQYGSFLVGKNGDYGTCHAYIKFNTLPKLSAGDVIVQAYFSIWQYDFSAVGTQEFKIIAYENSADWTESVTWNTKPGHGEAIDYTTAGPCVTNGTRYYYEKTLDITKLARKWYAGTNYGVMLASAEDRLAEARFFTADYPFGTSGAREGSSEQYPSGIFIYRNTNGVEDYWSYHSASTPFGLVGLVNDATGALTMMNTDVSGSGGNFSFVLTRTYNINNLWKEPAQGIKSGIGWTTNLNQYLYWQNIGTTRYCVYVDADGTSHYIRDTGNGWYDEDGRGLKLDFYQNDHSITDKDGNKVRFTNVNGKIYPYRMEDKNGTYVHISYANNDYNKPIEAKDKYGRITTFEYNSAGRLETVTDPVGRKTTYSYDGEGQYLGTITYADGQYTRFGYIIGGSGNKTLTVRDSNRNGLRYTTDSAGRVLKAEEIGSNGSIRLLYDIGYKAVNVMRYTYANGLSEDYQSDDFGRVLSITSSEGYGAYTGFTTETTDIKANNKTSFVSNVQKSVVNHAINGSAENGEANWDHEGWNGYSGVSATRSTDAKLGNYSWQITKESFTGTYHKRSTFKVEKSKTYTLSAYVKANLTTDGGNGGAQIYVIYFDNNGNQCRANSDPVVSTGDEWKRISVTFTNLQHTGTIYIFAGITAGASGTAKFDCIQLEEGETVNRYNTIENGSFERDLENVATSGTVSVVSGSAPIGGASKSVKVTGSPDATTSAARFFSILNVPANTNVVVSAYGKATAAPMNTGDTYVGNQLTGNPRLFGIEVTAHYKGTSETYTQAIKFNEDLSSETWQYVSGVFNLSPNGNRDSDWIVNHLTVKLTYYGQLNTAQFDLLSLYVEEFGTEYTYDTDGNLISSVDAAEQSNTYTYGDDNLKKMISPTGSEYEYGYDGRKNLTDSTGAEGIRNIIKNDIFGNPIYTLTQGEDRNKSLKDGESYYIKNAQTGKYLDVSGTNVVQNSLSMSASQKWQLKQNKDGSYSITQHNSSSSYLATVDASTASGTGVVLSNASNSSTSFKIERTNIGTYNIKLTGNTNQILEIPETGYSGQTVQVATRDNKYAGNYDQQWYFEKVRDEDKANHTLNYRSEEPTDGEIYYIKNVYNGRYLENNNDVAGETLSQQIFLGEGNQKFLIKKQGNTLRIIPVLTENNGLETSLGASGNALSLCETTTENEMYYYTLVDAGNGAYKIASASDSTLYLRLPETATTYESSVPIGGSDSNDSRSWWVFEKAGTYMESSATYSGVGGYLSSVTAADGSVTTYDYNTSKGTLNSVTEPGQTEEGITTSYTYETSNDLLTQTTQGDASVSYEYSNRQLTELTSPSNTVYKFFYNAFNQVEEVKIGENGERALVTNKYDSLGRLEEVDYNNGSIINHTYDILSRITSVLYNGIEMIAYEYDNDGNVSKTIDSYSGITTEFNYDSVKRLVSMIASNGYELNLRYDDKNRVSEMSESIDGTGMTDKKTIYNYNELGVIDSVTTTQGTSATFETSYEFDTLYRVEDSTVKAGETDVLTNSYVYEKGQYAGSTTGMVESHTVGDKTYSYVYDVRGNITEISLNGTVIATYTYDEYDRLLTETANGTTTSWTYDINGNILTRSRDNTIIEYTYGDGEWKDLLTSYNGKAIDYDSIGNPWQIGDDLFTWEAGRILQSMKQGPVVTSFTYDSKGYRTSKTSSGVTTTYYLDGSRIAAMKIGNDELSFVYDEKGSIVGLYHNETPYVYAKNLRGDIIGIVDESGTWVVNYTYDAWGNPLSTDGTLASTLGTLNPFRYRGYVYDTETGYYYLTSRYYSPEMGRFLNADEYVSTGQGIVGFNMFAYCGNNPTNSVDSTGEMHERTANHGGFGCAPLWNYMAAGVLAGASAVITVGALIELNKFVSHTIEELQQEKIKLKAQERAEEKSGSLQSPTIIYRYGGTNPGNLTPKEKDKYSGLSFSTVPRAGSAMTTIEALNATGIVYAVQDNATHVSVRPVGATMEDWINAGAGSCWTQTIKSMVIKWDGGAEW